MLNLLKQVAFQCRRLPRCASHQQRFGVAMTQEQLNQIYSDICVHGRRVEGWSCDQDGDLQRMRDNKLQNAWERTGDGEWIESK